MLTARSAKRAAIILACFAVPLPAQVPSKPTVAVLPFSLGSHDSATVRRTNSLTVAIRLALAADTSVTWLPRDSAWIRQHRGGPPGPAAKYIVAGATLGLRNDEKRPDGRMRVDWYIINVETSNTSPKDSMTVLPGEDFRAATIIAGRIAATVREKSRRP